MRLRRSTTGALITFALAAAPILFAIAPAHASVIQVPPAAAATQDGGNYLTSDHPTGSSLTGNYLTGDSAERRDDPPPGDPHLAGNYATGNYVAGNDTVLGDEKPPPDPK
jgi:hypothetical protein